MYVKEFNNEESLDFWTHFTAKDKRKLLEKFVQNDEIALFLYDRILETKPW